MWRGKRIFFLLSGRVQLPVPGLEGGDEDPTFTLSKQHVGAYSNVVVRKYDWKSVLPIFPCFHAYPALPHTISPPTAAPPLPPLPAQHYTGVIRGATAVIPSGEWWQRTQEPPIELEGTYGTGSLVLGRQAGPGPMLCGLLSGRWRGASQAPGTGDSTRWARLAVVFAEWSPRQAEEPPGAAGRGGRGRRGRRGHRGGGGGGGGGDDDDEGAGEEKESERRFGDHAAMLALAGKGVSLWRGREVPFTLSGMLDLRALSVELEKTHTGEYTNTVRYSCGLNLDPAPPAARQSTGGGGGGGGGDGGGCAAN